MTTNLVENHVRLVGNFLRVFFIAIGCLFLSSIVADAHQAKAGWYYPRSCCSDQDCYILGETDPDENGLGVEEEPVLQGDYWVLKDGTKIHKDDTRKSPDGLFHVCRHNKRSVVIQPYEEKICLWVPEQGT